LHMPIALVSEPIRRVFIQKVSEKVNKGESILHFIITLSAAMALMLFFPFIIVEFYGEWLFQFVLGDKWILAGTVSKIIFPWIFMSFIITPLSSLYVIFRKQEIWLRFQLILNMSLLIVFLLAFFYAIEVFTLLKTLTIVNVIFNFFIFGNLIFLTKRYDTTPITVSQLINRENYDKLSK